MSEPTDPPRTSEARSSDAPAGTPPAGKKRLPATERRAQIIRSAIREFGRHGFKGATTKVLSEAANISEATIFKHFPTKSDLFLAAFSDTTSHGTDELVAQLQDLADQGDDAGLFREMTDAILCGYQANRDLHRMLLYAFLEPDPGTQATLSAGLWGNALTEFLIRHVATRQAEGAYRAGDPAELTACLMAMPVHLAEEQHLFTEGDSNPKLSNASPRPQATLIAELLLDAVRVRRTTDDTQ